MWVPLLRGPIDVMNRVNALGMLVSLFAICMQMEFSADQRTTMYR